MLRIAADHAMPYITDACTAYGEVLPFSPASPDSIRKALAKADALLCRSTLHVNEELLRGTPVRFVATATSGIDHIDTEYLTAQGIGFASAKGCNAQSVAEYVFFAILDLVGYDPALFRQQSLGVIGLGEVGSRVTHLARKFGMTVLCNDPPLQEATRSPQFVSLEAALNADIVTLHVPLTSAGPHPTLHLLHAGNLAHVKKGALLINTSRGEVVDMDAVATARQNGVLSLLVLDVFPGEPELHLRDIEVADLATPHIAGHSHDGKVRGTIMAANALCEFLRLPASLREEEYLSGSENRTLSVPEESVPARQLGAVLRQIYDVHVDDTSMRRLLSEAPETRTELFQELRRSYRIRRECACHVIPAHGLHPSTRSTLQTLGVTLS